MYSNIQGNMPVGTSRLRGVILGDLRAPFFWGGEANLGVGRVGTDRRLPSYVSAYDVAGRVYSNIEGVMTIMKE